MIWVFGGEVTTPKGWNQGMEKKMGYINAG
jgi:hypothetical protein